MPFLHAIADKTLKREWAFVAFLWWLSLAERYIYTASPHVWDVAKWSTWPVWSLIFGALGLDTYRKQILPLIKGGG